MKILFITSNRIGDAVLSTGVLHYLIKKYQDAYVTVACGPASAGLFEGIPQLQDIIIMHKSMGAAHWLKLWYSVVSTHWDITVDMRSSVLTYVVRSKRRHIYRTPKDDRHRVLQLADLLNDGTVPNPVLWPKLFHVQQAEKLLANLQKPILVGPMATWFGKQWPAERFAHVLNDLRSQRERLLLTPILVLGGPGETAPAFFETIDPDARVINLIGTMPLLTIYSLMQRSLFYFGNDSGLMHMAAASGIPTLGLFGPSRENHYSPWGGTFVRTPESFDDIIKRPDYDRHKQISWMTSLTTDDVLIALNNMIDEKELVQS